MYKDQRGYIKGFLIYSCTVLENTFYPKFHGRKSNHTYHVLILIHSPSLDINIAFKYVYLYFTLLHLSTPSSLNIRDSAFHFKN